VDVDEPLLFGDVAAVGVGDEGDVEWRAQPLRDGFEGHSVGAPIDSAA